MKQIIFLFDLSNFTEKQNKEIIELNSVENTFFALEDLEIY